MLRPDFSYSSSNDRPLRAARTVPTKAIVKIVIERNPYFLRTLEDTSISTVAIMDRGTRTTGTCTRSGCEGMDPSDSIITESSVEVGRERQSDDSQETSFHGAGISRPGHFTGRVLTDLESRFWMDTST